MIKTRNAGKALFILPPHRLDYDAFTKPSWGICRIPPVGLMAVGSYLHDKGHDVRIIDCRELIVKHRTNEYTRFIVEAVEEFKPDIIGINVLTALFYEAEMIAHKLKKCFPDCVIIAGGPHPSVEPELTFRQNQYIDAICVGPGEEVCLDILNGKKLSNVRGLMCRGRIGEFEGRAVERDIDKYPFPDYSLVDSDYYTEFTLDNVRNGWGYRGLVALTSRSCPYSCRFCASDWSKPFRFHSPEYVVEMVKYLSSYDIDVVGFFDDSIGAIPDRLYKICEGFIKAKLFWPYSGMRWLAAMRANQIKPDILEIMKRAGCFNVNIGIESGTDRMLKVLNKKTTVEMNRRACNYVREAGLHLTVSFMVGIPGETEGEMNETIAFMQSLDCNSKGMGSFRPLPGSPFYREFAGNGVLPKEDIDWENLGNFSIPSKYVFCDMPGERFGRVFDRALNIAAIKSWTTVHEDILQKYPELIREIACRTRIRVCKPGDYYSSSHTVYRPLSVSSVYSIGNDALLRLYAVLPYRLRRWVRAMAPRFRKMPFLGNWMAGY